MEKSKNERRERKKRKKEAEVGFESHKYSILHNQRGAGSTLTT